MTDVRVIAVGAPPTFRQQVARALDTTPEAVEWLPTVTAAEELLASSPELADVMVLSPSIKEVDAFGFASFLLRSAPATAVVLVRDRASNGLLPSAMRAGIRDVVDLSKGSQELQEALERTISWAVNLRSFGGEARAAVGGTRGVVVSIFSSKGGTGKTFLTCNLATAISQRSGKETAILDGDFVMGDVLSYFGREASRSLQDLLAVGGLSDPEAVKAAGVRLSDNLVAYSAPLDPAAEPVSGDAMARVLRSLRATFPYTVVDASASYSDQALAALDVSDMVFIITSLDLVAVRHLSSALRTLLTLGVHRDRFRVVLNRADSKVGLDPSEVERVLKIKVDASIPSSRLVPLSLNRGRPVYLEDSKSAVAKSIDALADKVMALAPGDAGVESTEPSVAANPEPRKPEHRRRGLFRKSSTEGA